MKRTIFTFIAIFAFVGILDAQQESSWYNSGTGGLMSDGVVRSGKTVLMSLHAWNNNAAARWIQVFDSATSPPADGTVAVFQVRCAAQSQCAFDLQNRSIRFSTGLTWATSTTTRVLTIGASDAHVYVEYLSR